MERSEIRGVCARRSLQALAEARPGLRFAPSRLQNCAMAKSPINSDKAAALALTPVSRETESRLDAYVDLLLLWQEKTNLVSSSTLPNLWTRHISDSLQLLAFAADAK